MRAEEAARLFDSNAAHYDRVNRIVSLGLERGWRAWAARAAAGVRSAEVLDAFAGTGAVGIPAAGLGAKVTLADASEGMLAIAEREAASRRLPVRVVHADLSADLPFEAASFDAVTTVFAVRYLDDPAAVLRRLAAVLRPDGRMVVMEFVEPPASVLGTLAGAYFFRALPALAAWLAGSRELYDYLGDSTVRLGSADALDAIVRRAGLRIVQAESMGFGLVRGIIAKP